MNKYDKKKIVSQKKIKLVSKKPKINKVKYLEKKLLFINSRLKIALTQSNTVIFKSAITFMKEVGVIDLKDNWMMNIHQLYGYPEGTKISQKIIIKHIHPDDILILKEGLIQALLDKKTVYEKDYRIIWNDRSIHWLSLKANLNFEQKNKIIIKGSVSDITDKKINADKIQYLATCDSLTGLLNRDTFLSFLEKSITNSKVENKKFALLTIDLDRFKVINDTLGDETGNFILKEVGKKINSVIKKSDIAARLGSDEFIVLLNEVETIDEVSYVAKKMLDKISESIKTKDQDTSISASIGISIYPEDGEDKKSLIKSAEVSMNAAKESGKNNYQFYTQEIKNKYFEKVNLEKHLRNALEKDELHIVYQAKVNFKTGIIKGVEALIRWDNPVLGSVSPIRFIPVAEETGLIIPIGKWIMKTAYRQSKLWIEQGLPPIEMAINLSCKQFLDDKLLEDIREIINQTNISGVFMELELTESTIMKNPEKVVHLLKSIKDMGVKIAIDDFGTGYSSLSHIQKFPIDTLKIDRFFIKNLENSKNDQGIAKAIIAMAKTLNMTVIAEGVETKEQADFLIDNSCDEMQGYYFSKPITSSMFIDFYKAHLKKTNIFV